MDELVNSIHYKNELFAPWYIAKYGYGLSIEFIETTADFPKLEAKDIVENSLTLKQSLCSKEFLIYGGCVASEFSFKTYNSELRAKQNISGAKIQFSIYPLKDGGVSLPEQTTALFTGWIENAVRDPITGCLQITAYDAFRRFQNTSVGDWFEDFVNRGVIVKEYTPTLNGQDLAGWKAKVVSRPEQFDFLNDLAHQMGFKWEETKLKYNSQYGVYVYPDQKDSPFGKALLSDIARYIFPYQHAAVPLNRKSENLTVIDALNQLCLANGCFAMVSGDGGLSLIKLMNAGYESIDNHADGTFTVSKTPDSLILSADEYDASSLSYDESEAWGPHTFICDPNPCITYTATKKTADELYAENRYTIRNNFFIGDSDFINEYFGCDEYGTPSAQVPAYEEKTKYNGDSDSDIIIYPNVCYGPIIETQNLSVIEYSVKAYQDPTIKLGTNISIYLDNSKYIKSRIISRTLTFVSDRAIIAEYSANSAPYNNCTYSDDKYKTFTADMEKTKKALPTVACGGSVYKLKTCKVLSKEEYDALTEKRTDTLYYVIEPES